MKNKIITAAGILFLVFVLIIVGALFAKMMAEDPIPEQSIADQVNYQSTLTAYETQQQAYENLIQQANDQLMNANATFAAMADSTETMPTNSPGLTPDEAIALAQVVAFSPDSQTGTPELVNFEGTVAYEVKYEIGVIYVDFATGDILLNGTLTLTDEITIEQAEEIAKNYLGLTSVYLSDIVTINGTQYYRIIFNAGHFVYVNFSGQIIYVQMYAKETTPTMMVTSDNDDRRTPIPHGDDDGEEHEKEDD